MDFLNESNSGNFSNEYTNSSTTGEYHHSSAILPVIFGIICFLGIMGNYIVIYTIMKKTKCRAKLTVPDIFILNLSIVDLLFLLGMPFLIHQLLGNGTWHFGGAMCTVITALDSNSQIVSTYILTAMTFDRYLATVHPIRFNYVRTQCVATLVMYWYPVNDTYWFTLYQFFLAFAIPLAIICVVFFKILQHMSTSVAPLPPRSLRVRNRKVTRMAVAICLAFFICWAPYYILQLVHLGVHKPSAAFSYTYNIAISMGYTNSCINPFLYIILSEAFKRQVLRAVFPVNRKFRVIPSTTDGGSVSVRMIPERAQQEPASGELNPLNPVPQ
uniref:Melanin-concentrating hormone receptor 1 n=1 Tax=Neogobius melanostomus TaxID=47308 RepID=A0A8C6SY43_9GOBI